MTNHTSHTKLSWIKTPRPIGLIPFLLGFAIFNTLVFNYPVQVMAWQNLQLSSLTGLMTFATLIMVQLWVMMFVLTLVSFLPIRVLKAVCIVFLLGNAVALYFINTYQVILDRDMMGNVFNTDSRESMELIHPKLFVYLLVLGVLPSIVVAKLTIVKNTWGKRVIGLVVGVVLLLVWAYVSGKTWLWFDKYGKRIGGTALPWSYVVNAIRFQTSNIKPKPMTLLPPLSFATNQSNQKTVVVVVIGESARADRFSLNGYAKPTNPLLTELANTSSPAKFFSPTQSCATFTTAGVKCLLSTKGNDTAIKDNDEPLPSYLHRHGVYVIWRSNNWGEPPLEVDSYQKAGDIAKTCQQDCDNLKYDEVLLYGLKEQITQVQQDKVVVFLHQTASHGPAYSTKYPPAFAKFQPVCQSVELQKCTQEQLSNAYDNTIVYTDYFLHKLISELQTLDNTQAVMLYQADHGESLGESGFYLHGTPMAVAPKEQTQIPFIAWVSPNFWGHQALYQPTASAPAKYEQGYIFHSVLGALQANSSVYRPELDIFHQNRDNQ